VNAQALSPRVETLLALADDELIVGWRDSEWTGIAPTLEEDVAFSSIAQNEIGHARALYELAAIELGTDADALAFDREPGEYRCAPLVELRLLDDWAMTIARRYLYEIADEIRLHELMGSADAELGGLAAKIDREEVYHRLHAELWAARLRAEPRFIAAVEELWPFALGMLEPALRPELARRVGRASNSLLQAQDPSHLQERGAHMPELAELLSEMTEVRRSEPGAQW
jgi:ring-1,2-phenylacetyl-CoA epoxidase subunit PaaC